MPLPPFIDDLREILLQEYLDGPNGLNVLLDGVDLICTALLYGNTADGWRHTAYFALQSLTETATGGNILANLEMCGRLTTHLVQQIIEEQVARCYLPVTLSSILFH